MPDSTVDWFVAAGSLSGDGSREKPFHDPWLALRCAGPGDVIHIAAGTYADATAVGKRLTLQGPNAGLSAVSSNDRFDA